MICKITLSLVTPVKTYSDHISVSAKENLGDKLQILDTVWFNGISTLVSYLMFNTVCLYVNIWEMDWFPYKKCFNYIYY